MANIDLYSAFAFNKANSKKDAGKSAHVFEVITIAAATMLVAGAALVS